MKSKTLIFSVVITAFFISACGSKTETANTNTQNSSISENQNESNSQSENAKNISNQAAKAEVPQFADANEAIAKGDEYIDASQPENAIKAFKQATVLDPDNAEAHFKLGVAYSLIESDDAPAGAGDEQPAGSKTKGKSKVPTQKRDSEVAYENAIKAYKKLIAKNPKDAEAYHNLGLSYNKLFEDEDARNALQKAVDLKPDDSEFRTDLGAVNIKLAKYPEASKQLEKALELDPENFRADDLLTEAKAGRKRTDFNKDKKTKQPSQQQTPGKEK